MSELDDVISAGLLLLANERRAEAAAKAAEEAAERERIQAAWAVIDQVIVGFLPAYLQPFTFGNPEKRSYFPNSSFGVKIQAPGLAPIEFTVLSRRLQTGAWAWSVDQSEDKTFTVARASSEAVRPYWLDEPEWSWGYAFKTGDLVRALGMAREQGVIFARLQAKYDQDLAAAQAKEARRQAEWEAQEAASQAASELARAAGAPVMTMPVAVSLAEKLSGVIRDLVRDEIQMFNEGE